MIRFLVIFYNAKLQVSKYLETRLPVATALMLNVYMIYGSTQNEW